MLRTLPENHKSHWKDYVNKVVHAYNCTPNESTGFSPFYLLYGRSPRLPIDLVLGTENRENTPTSYGEYVKKWKTAMQEAYNLALKKSQQSSTRGARNYNRRLNFTLLQAGDRVLVRNLTPRGGPGKLRAYWENDVYVVISRRGTGPVYEVRREGGEGKTRVLHRNLLFPCDFLQPTDKRPPPRAQRRPRQGQRQRNQPSEPDMSDGSDTESEHELALAVRPRPVEDQTMMTNDEHDKGQTMEENDGLEEVEMLPSDGDNDSNDIEDGVLEQTEESEEREVSQSVDQHDDPGPVNSAEESRYPSRERRLPERWGYDVFSNTAKPQTTQDCHQVIPHPILYRVQPPYYQARPTFYPYQMPHPYQTFQPTHGWHGIRGRNPAFNPWFSAPNLRGTTQTTR